MSSYLRPSVDAPVFRDADGQVIDYGNRWEGHPPEDTYSVVTHRERFAPITVVADALIAHLRETYDVELVEGAHTATDLLHQPTEVARSVRVQPNDPACAALTFVFPANPAVVLHAGLLHDFLYPTCGCDACDSNWELEADELERYVFAVVTGQYREAVGRGLDRCVEFSLTYPDGASSGRSRFRDFPEARLKAAKPILRSRPDGWAPWPHAIANS